MPRLLITAVVAIAMLVGCFALGSAPAAAHATLERTEPAANASLPAEPRRVVLVFDEPVALDLGHVTVLGPDGTSVAAGQPSGGGGTTITVALAPGAGSGTYVVSYRVTSLDTHPVSGGFYFRVGAGPAARGPLPPDTGATGPAEDATVRAVYAACRYAGFIGLLLLAGSVVFLVAEWTDRRSARRVVHQGWLGLCLVAAGSVGELILQAPYAAGTSLTTGITSAAVGHVVHTTFGTAHLVRLALMAVAAPVLGAVHPGAPGVARPRLLRAAAASLVSALAITWAAYGHAATTLPALSVPTDVLHLAAMAVWVGGLTVLATAVLPMAAPSHLRRVLPRWSGLAMICVAALVLSGTVQALIEVAGWSGLTGTTYGQLLLAKIGLLGAVLLIANYSRRWVARWYSAAARPAADAVAPMPDPSAQDVRGLRRAVAFESLLAVAAVAVAAMLIEAAPGRSAPAIPLTRSVAHRPVITRHGAYVAKVRCGDVVIHLKVDPAVVGVQYIYLDATRPDGRRIPVRQWGLSVSNAALGLDHVRIPVLIDSGIGHHFVYGSFTMTTGGIWTVQVTARTSDGEETVVTRRVAVRS